jgi:hypothetical protein
MDKLHFEVKTLNSNKGLYHILTSNSVLDTVHCLRYSRPEGIPANDCY